ncbi:hypothetical protein [Cryptosporangium japonicum]|uniref:DUF4333 domain-containing protein n=1 Tax=Cryptosporangium japonicum TaxID=80872 RepID=A0ABN0U5C4_9ACTN
MTTPGTEPTPAVDSGLSPDAPSTPPPFHVEPGSEIPVSPAITLPPAVSPAGVPAMAGAEAWSRGSASIPTGYSAPPSFDSPGYGYGYAAAPAWGPAITGPKAWPVAAFTLLFGIFGAISAARRSSDARALGLPGGRYWGVFAGALVASFAVWTLVLGIVIAITVPLYLNYKSTVMTTTELEQALVSSPSADGSVVDATCIESAVNPVGVGTYECLVHFDNGTDLPYRITVASDGSWAASVTD